MNKKTWRKRFAERSDLTTNLVHLTKSNGSKSSVDVVLQILESKRLKGSNTKSGFIIGKKPAVCFQDTPIYSLSQNIYYEQKLRESNSNGKVRYVGSGLLFKKLDIYRKGGRPVIYDKSIEAKKYLPSSEYWRIVNFDLKNDAKIIDWTHEREWRVPIEYEFELKDTVVLMPNFKAQKDFTNKFEKQFGCNPMKKLKGIIDIGQIFY